MWRCTHQVRRAASNYKGEWMFMLPQLVTLTTYRGRFYTLSVFARRVSWLTWSQSHSFQIPGSSITSLWGWHSDAWLYCQPFVCRPFNRSRVTLLMQAVVLPPTWSTVTIEPVSVLSLRCVLSFLLCLFDKVLAFATLWGRRYRSTSGDIFRRFAVAAMAVPLCAFL
jgi:hypothetical protein